MSLQPRLQEDDLDRLWNDLPRLIEQDDGYAVKELLAKGIPAYYSEDDTPEGLLIRENPDGTRQLVRVSFDGDDIVIQNL
ncbi:hypothetical protein [Telmatospirillum siberiense]|uniref:Uncharacterized protein n=1 Tax=Telmatospirillum siberiense TaxID=382514 RepID=A0A2N3Q0A2_9PROT|nr:hypothetical protein [Telmatospirillum siberiense]PKU26080.1 hypothetical protein CWS72_02805 [Telmatospirillum siberiense]